MQSLDARTVLQALIDLNRLETELKSLGPRSTRKEALDRAIAAERPKVPSFILAHHDRIRGRGRSSTFPVRDWICRSCFISVPSGLRTKLASRDDICVCENCGAYIYLPTEEEERLLLEDELKKRELAHKAATPAPKACVPVKSKPKPQPKKKISKPASKAKARPRSSSAPAKKSPRKTASKRR